jgi:curved DNA-binding protein CbpA
VFKDYYAILKIPFDTSVDKIRAAYKRQALRWHPDKNPEKGSKEIMQDINEAYLILKDAEARIRYNNEYKRYKSHREQEHEFTSTSSMANNSPKENQYEFYDEILKKWMENAREQASNLVSQTLKEIKIGTKAAGKEMFQQSIIFVLVGIIFSILIRSCN